MYSISEIKERLKITGFKDDEIDSVIKDVFEMISLKVGEYIASGANKEAQEKIKNLKIEEMDDYLKNNPGEIPQLTSEKFKDIYQTTWDNYFEIIQH